MATVSRVPIDLPATYYRAIGEVIARWAHFEWRLLHSLELHMNISPKQARVLGVGMAGKAKIGVVKNYVQNWCPDGKAKKDLLGVCKDALKLIERRNHVAHGVWGSPTSRKLGIIHMTEGKHRILPHREVLSSKDVLRIAKDIRALQVRYDKAIDRLIASQSPSPGR